MFGSTLMRVSWLLVGLMLAAPVSARADAHTRNEKEVARYLNSADIAADAIDQKKRVCALVKDTNDLEVRPERLTRLAPRDGIVREWYCG